MRKAEVLPMGTFRHQTLRHASQPHGHDPTTASCTIGLFRVSCADDTIAVLVYQWLDWVHTYRDSLTCLYDGSRKRKTVPQTVHYACTIGAEL